MAANRNGAAVKEAEPAWDIASIYPNQGQWDENEYLAVTASTNRLIEFRDGFVEVLAMPTMTHQRIVLYLLWALERFVATPGLGEVLVAALRVRLRKRLYREPDIVFMLAEHEDRMGEDFWEGADLVMEVVSGSPNDRERDLVTKRREYAAAGIPEYWIVDPQERRVTVLVLAGKRKSYAVHGEFGSGEKASSKLLAGFEVEVSKVFEAARKTRQR